MTYLAGAKDLSVLGGFAVDITASAATAVTLPTSGTLATTSQLPTPAALTKADDTNVTLTLGGTPTTALLQATSITAGWAGTLALTRGGLAASLTASDGGIFYSTATAGAILSGTATANQLLMSGSSTAPAWSTATYPATTTANQLLYSSATNTVGGLATGNDGALITSGAGVPSISSTLPTAVQNNITTLGTISSIFITSSGQRVKRTATATSYTVLSSDFIIAVTDTTADRTITLPAATGNSGQVFIVKDESGAASGANSITIDTAAGNIDGDASVDIDSGYASLTFYSNGINYFIM